MKNENTASPLTNDKLALLFCKRVIRRLIAACIYRFDSLEGNKNQSNWTILRYKRVTIPENHPYPISVTHYVRPNTFEKHLKFLATACHVISLDELVKLIECDSPIPKKTVVITLDDGWLDNYQYAYPLLKKHSLPATIFLPTSFVGTMDMFWPEKIVAAMLSLFDAGITFSSIPFVKELFPDLYTQAPEDLGTVIAKTETLVNCLKQLDFAELIPIMAEIGIASDSTGGFKTERSFLNWEEVIEISNSSNISFGTQGSAHSLFNNLTREEIAIDLRNAYLQFRKHSIAPSRVVCYTDNYLNNNSKRALKDLGVTHALAIGEVQEQKNSKPMILGRMPMYEAISHSTDLFACRLWRASALGVAF